MHLNEALISSPVELSAEKLLGATDIRRECNSQYNVHTINGRFSSFH